MITQPSILIRTGLASCILATLSSCAGPKLGNTIELNTLITDRGIKLFEMTYPGAAKDPMRLSLRPQNKPWSERKIMNYLNAALEQSGYCNKGFVTLGRHAGETTHKVRGECKDLATPNDRANFPDTIQIW